MSPMSCTVAYIATVTDFFCSIIVFFPYRKMYCRVQIFLMLRKEIRKSLDKLAFSKKVNLKIENGSSIFSNFVLGAFYPPKYHPSSKQKPSVT